MAGQQLLQQGADRRAAILGFLREYHAANGWAPSQTEINDAVGLVSPNVLRTHLQRLADEGYLRMAPRQARCIALIDPAPDGWTRS